MYRKLFAVFIFVFISTTSFAQLTQPGILALIGFSDQELVYVTEEATPAVTSISSLAATAAIVHVFDETVYVLNSDDYTTNQGSGLWFADISEIQAALDEERAVNWEVIDLPDGTNPYDMTKVNDYLFISYQQANSVVALDMANSFEVVETFSNISYPQGLAYNGQYVAVAESGLGSGTHVYLIDPETLATPVEVTVGTNPQWLDVDSQGNFYTVCTGNYADIAGSAWKLDMSGEAVSTSSVELGGTPASIKIITDNQGNEIGYTGDEYAFGTPCYYAWNCADLTAEDTGMNDITGGWCLAGDGNTLYYGSSMYNTLGRYSLDGFGQPSQMATLDGEVSSIVYWQGETNEVNPSDLASVLPQTARLLSVWPNPFNAATTVKINMANGSGGELMVVNTLGRIVQKINLNGYSAGEHQLSIDGGNMTSGTYFLMLETENGIATRKITLVK